MRTKHRVDYRYSKRKDARRDYYRFRTINHLIRVGARIATRPRTSTTVIVRGTTYYYAGGVYYVRSGSSYVVVHPVPGAVVYSVPTATTIVYVGTTPYYYYGGTYYVHTDTPAPKPAADSAGATAAASTSSEAAPPEDPPMIEGEENYEVVAPPVGASVPYLPEEAESKTIDGSLYYVYEGTYYKPFASEDETVYMVVEKP